MATTTLPFLSPRDAGRVLGISTSRVQQLGIEGKLHEYRDSAGRRMFAAEDVERLRVERERTARR